MFTACPKCVLAEGINGRVRELLYIRDGIAGCDKHGEMTIEEVKSLYATVEMTEATPVQPNGAPLKDERGDYSPRPT